jgi:hypothetical protein
MAKQFSQLHKDAPPVPEGLRPKRGVEYGCGAVTCARCYEKDDTRPLAPAPTAQEARAAH